MTTEDWKQLEESLRTYEFTRLIVDGNELTLSEVRSGNKVSIMLFVNRYCTVEEIEENQRKYLFEQKRAVYTGKRKREIKKVSKRFLREVGIDPDRKVSVRSPFFPSFRALKSHLTKNNTSIEFKKSE